MCGVDCNYSGNYGGTRVAPCSSLLLRHLPTYTHHLRQRAPRDPLIAGFWVRVLLCVFCRVRGTYCTRLRTWPNGGGGAAAAVYVQLKESGTQCSVECWATCDYMLNIYLVVYASVVYILLLSAPAGSLPLPHCWP